jgi:hypothetical protein
MNRRNSLLVLAAITIGAGWYLFRPERLFIDSTVNEDLPKGAAVFAATPAPVEAAAAPILAGRFHTNAHETKGLAAIHTLPDGRRVLRLTDFETSNGPDVRVYLVAASDVNDNDTVKRVGFVELGPMKGNKGDQNYEIPAGVDLDTHRAVTIWCRRFSVNFGTAPLT